MFKNYRWYSLALIAFVAMSAAPAWAEQVRFRFVPIDACGNTQQVPAGPDGALGEKLSGAGIIPKAFPGTFRPTHMVTFKHPFNGRNIIVPLSMPQGQARMEYRSDRIIYNYGSYVIEVRFLTSGGAEAVYNSGFLRPLNIQ